MKTSIKLLILAISLLVFQACYYDVEEKLYPSTNTICDTTNVTLSAVVKPILQGSCYGCHSIATANTQGLGINLETYVNLKVTVDNGKLLKSIKHESAFPMPKGSTAKIDACDIIKISKWVSLGAKND